MAAELILLGAGGHALACIDVIEAGADWSVAGLVAPNLEPGSTCHGYPVLGGDDALPELFRPGQAALVALGHLGRSEMRRKLFERARELGFSLPVVSSPSAWVSPRAEVGAGTAVMHRATVQAGAKVGENCILNDHCLIEHGALLGADVHVSTGALVNGEAQIGAGALIGSGAVLRQGVRVAPGVVVGAGAVVVRDLDQPGTYVGNPARILNPS